MLILIALLLIQTDWGQNLIIKQVTRKLSKDLNTEVSIKRISIDFFDKLNLEGALIRDQKKDTLLYAGKLKTQVTDWFFLKDEIELKYFGLEDAIVYLNRKDSVWNYQFIIDSLAPPNPNKKTSDPNIALFLKKVDLKNISFLYRDGWIGQDMTGRIGSLEMDADEFNIMKKKIFVSALNIDKPFFAMRDYDGNRPSNPNNKAKLVTMAKNGEMRWNTEGWDILISRLSLRGGMVQFETDTERKPYNYFDPSHILFGDITGTIKDFSVWRDTISGQIDLKTKERSGFEVTKLKAFMRFHPEGMIFRNLDLQTPNSRLRDYYAMRYKSFNEDMKHFLNSVKLEANFSNSTLSSKDIAFFAPELKDINETIQLSGSAKGTVEDFQATNLKAQYGKNTYVSGNLRMRGLPDINTTYIDLQNGELRTTYEDVVQLAPQAKKITDPDLASLQFIRFNGNFKGYIDDFTTKGTLQTALGNITADIAMQFPSKGSPTYKGFVETDGFDLGKFLKVKDIGKIAFSGDIKGLGFETSGAIDMNGTVKSIEFNDYLYRNVVLNGSLLKKQFTGKVIIDDPNVKATLNGYFNLNDPNMPELNATAEIQRANLRALNFTKDNYSVLGKFKVNFLGNNIDDFVGEASLFDVALTKDDQTYVFDTLQLYAMNIDENRQIEVKNADISMTMNGKFKLSEVPATIANYLAKYYPAYFDKPNKPLSDESFTFRADLTNIDQYLKLFNKDLSGFDYSSIEAHIDSKENIFNIKASIPQARFGKYSFEDFVIDDQGSSDTMRIKAMAGTISINDSLKFPTTEIDVLVSKNVSDINIRTAANQTINAASLSASVKHLKDGVTIYFRPSTVVLNEKTWSIENKGELTISRSVVDASEIRISNGEQQITISSIPSELGNSHDIVATLHRVNLGDIIPFIFTNPRIQGITSGEVTVEDPLGKVKVYVNAQTEQTRFEEDSIGITSLNGYWDNARQRANFNLSSDNKDYQFDLNGSVNLEDSSNQIIDATADLQDTRVSLVKTYLRSVFSTMDGKAKGKIRIVGKVDEPDLVGDLKLTEAGVKVDYTGVYYKLEDPTISFKPGLIDIGEIVMVDELGNKGVASGSMQHKFFRNMVYNFKASSNKMLIVNTTKLDNDIFYGRVIGDVNFNFTGPESNMKMYISGRPVDSSRMVIQTESDSKRSGEVDYIVWRQYGREMNTDSLERDNTNLLIDLDLTANNYLRMTVVLDENTGDSITATGSGNLKILTGTKEAMVMNGRYNIERGNYNFNFQDIFNKPFVLEQGSGSYISWTGDPYDAEINIRATYTAEKVRISSMFESSNTSGVSSVNSDVMSEISDVIVNCVLTGTLSAPNPSFEISLPSNSPVKNNPSVDNKLKTINRDANEVSKQSTYLIVFKSFAPQAAIVTSDLNQELISNTISGVINAILASSVQNFFTKLFGNSVDVNFNYSRVANSLSTTGSTGTNTSSTNWRENVSLQFIKSLVNNRLILTFGSDFNFAAVAPATGNTQSFLFLPDVNVEYKITPDGKFRTSFFYRSSFDALSSSGRRDRTGGNISFRTEFDHIFNRRKRKDSL